MPVFGTPEEFSLIGRLISSGSTIVSRAVGSRLNIGASFSDILGNIQGASSSIDMAQFQSGPFTAAQAETIYGAASEFMSPSGSGPGSRFLEEYQKFQDKYFEAISNQRNLGLGKRVDVDIQKMMGKIDLTVLNYQQQEAFKRIFRDQVLQAPNLFNEVGLPGVMLPSANRYRIPFRYNTLSSQQDMHPAQLMLSRMVFNINRNKLGMEAVGFNISNIMTVERLRSTTEQMHNFGDLFSPARQGQAAKKIYTIDVETTGVFEGSQIRSMAIAEMDMAKSGPDAVRILGEGTDSSFNVLFESSQLRGYTVSGLNGITKTLNEHIAQIEGGPGGARLLSMGDDGSSFLDESSRFLNKLMEADVVTGHNITFDIEKMVETMTAMPGFHSHNNAAQAVTNFFAARNEGRVQIIDTLEVARQYLENEANAILGGMQGLDEFQRSEEIVKRLFSSEVLARVEIGGSASWASVENIALNTNLFELIYQREGTQVANQLLGGGASHTSEVDTKLQSYMAKYIHTAELKFLRDPNSPTLAYNAQGIDRAASDYGETMRSKTLRSLAITPTTNIADITQLSDQMFESIITSDDLLKRVTIRGRAEQLLTDQALSTITSPTVRGASHLVGTTGTIGFSENLGQYIYSADVRPASGLQSVTTEIDRGKVEAILRAARQGGSAEQRMIQDFGFNISQMTAANDIAAMGISSSVRAFQADDILQMPAEELIEGLSTLSTRFAPSIYDSVQMKDLRTGLVEMGHRFNLFGASMPDIADQAARQDFISGVGRAMASIGSPFAGLIGIRDQIFSANIAQATSDIAEAASRASQHLFESGDIDQAALKNTLFTKHAKELSELGISMFNAQKESKILKQLQAGQTYKVLMETDVAKKAVRNVLGENVGIQQVGLSMVKGRLSPIDKQPIDTINLVWHISRQMNKDQVEQFAVESLNILNERSNLLSYGSAAAQDIQEDIAMLRQIQLTTGGRQAGQALVLNDELRNNEIFSSYMKSIMDNGIVVGNVQGSVATKIRAVVMGLNIPMLNDIFLSKYRGDLLEVNGLSDSHIAVGAMYDRTAPKLAGVQSDQLLDASNQQVARANLYAERLEQLGDGARRDLLRRMQGRGPGSASSLADFYVSNKKNIRLGALGLAASIAGYYGAKKYEERQIYNEPFEQQPYERGRQISSLNDYSRETYNLNAPRMDPLATAGVVGNLDRAKINHTSMNPFKNNNLFGGQL